MGNDDPSPPSPPDIDHQVMDDRNFATGDLDQAWNLMSSNRFLVHKAGKDADTYVIMNPGKQALGQVEWVGHGGWAIQGPQGANGPALAMLWRQHTEDHSQEHLSNLVHWGFHRYERAKANEENASIYCLANLDRTVRLFITYKGTEAILDSPTNRPVLKIAPGEHHGDVRLVDAYNDPVATVHTEAGFQETHEVSFEEAEDPFLVVLFAVTLGLEMDFRYGTWKSPFAHTDL